MAEDPTIDQTLDPTGEPTGQEQEAVVDPSQQQIQADPYAVPDNLKSRYKSAEEIAEFAANKQAEADRLKREYEDYKRRHPEPNQQPQQPSNDEVLDRLVKDPIGLITEVMAPLAAQVGLQTYANSGHPEIKDQTFMREMEAIIERNPAIVRDPQGLDMAYAYVKQQVDAGRFQRASEVKTQQNAQTQQLKRTDAVVETSATAQRGASPILKPGMTVDEMDKALDATGVGWISDEERHKFEE